jgi:hypothetical protein
VKKKTETDFSINLLDLIPVRNIEWEKGDKGLAVLLKPKYQSVFLQKHVLPRFKKPHYRIKLDDFGSFVWNACDGARTVKETGDMLRKEFGEEIEPLYERLSQFFHSLEKNGFIVFKGIPKEIQRG